MNAVDKGRKEKIGIMMLNVMLAMVSIPACASHSTELEEESALKTYIVSENDDCTKFDSNKAVSGSIDERTANPLIEGIEYSFDQDEVKEWVDFLKSKGFIENAESKIAEDYIKYYIHFYDSEENLAGEFFITTDLGLYDSQGHCMENDGLSGMLDVMLWKYYGNRVDNLNAVDKIEELLQCNRKAAESIEEICHRADIEGITDVAEVSNGACVILKISTNEPMDYYMFLEEDLFVQQIRKGSVSGEQIYRTIEEEEKRVK